jgi:cytochrome b subunit of formate dehydrogenase
MFFVHVYLSVMHPLMRPLSKGAWASMAYGKVPVEYVMSHHAKWYNEEIAVHQKPEGDTARRQPARTS